MAYELKKHWYKWPVIIITGVAVLALSSRYVFADGIKEAAIYNMDQSICGLKIGDDWIVNAITKATTEYNIDSKTAVEAYTQATEELKQVIYNKPYKDVLAYCMARTAR